MLQFPTPRIPIVHHVCLQEDENVRENEHEAGHIRDLCDSLEERVAILEYDHGLHGYEAHESLRLKELEQRVAQLEEAADDHSDDDAELGDFKARHHTVPCRLFPVQSSMLRLGLRMLHHLSPDVPSGWIAVWHCIAIPQVDCQWTADKTCDYMQKSAIHLFCKIGGSST